MTFIHCDRDTAGKTQSREVQNQRGKQTTKRRNL